MSPLQMQGANAAHSRTIHVKLFSTVTLAALLVAGSAFAADATSTPAKPAPAAVSSTAMPAKADHHCRDDANGKKLAGAARKSFMKKCLADARAAK
jgi:hypothetical protein